MRNCMLHLFALSKDDGKFVFGPQDNAPANDSNDERLHNREDDGVLCSSRMC